jgi:hypothetical protein
MTLFGYSLYVRGIVDDHGHGDKHATIDASAHTSRDLLTESGTTLEEVRQTADVPVERVEMIAH